MSLNILDQKKENDPRSSIKLELPKLRAPATAPQAQPPAPTQGQPGPFTRGQNHQPPTQSPTETPPVPLPPGSGIPKTDVSSMVNPWVGDLNQLSIADIQRLQIPTPIPAPAPQPTPELNPEKSDYDSLMKSTTESYETQPGGYAESANAILRSPQPIYAIPDPTDFSAKNPGPQDLGAWLDAQGHEDEAKTLPGNPFTAGEKKFKNNSTANAFMQGGPIGDFVKASNRDFINIRDMMNPLSWLKFGYDVFNSKDKVKEAFKNPLFKLFEGIGGDNGSYGDGAIGATLRALDLTDNAARGTVADLFGLKRVGIKNNGSNLYRTTIGGQDYSFFQPRKKGASPFAALPEKFSWTRLDHLGTGALALAADFATSAVTGFGVARGVKTLRRAIGLGKKAAGITDVVVPTVKQLSTVTKVEEALRRGREAIVSFDVAKAQVADLLKPLEPGALPNYNVPLVRKTQGLAGVVVDKGIVEISPSPSISLVKAPYKVQIQTQTAPALVPPRPFSVAVEQQGSELIRDESLRQAFAGTTVEPAIYPSVSGKALPTGRGSTKIGQEAPLHTPGGQSALTAALYDESTNAVDINPTFIRKPFANVQRVDTRYGAAVDSMNRKPKSFEIDGGYWEDALPPTEKARIVAEGKKPIPSTVYRRATGDVEGTVDNWDGIDHLEELAFPVIGPETIYKSLNIAKIQLEKGNVLLGMDYLRKAAGGYDGLVEDFTQLPRTVGKYFDSNGVFKANFTPEIARKIVKSYKLDAPLDVVEYVKSLFSQEVNIRALFKAASDDGSIIVDKTGNIIEKASVHKAMPLTEVTPPIVTGTDLTSSVDPQLIAGQVVSRSIDEIPENPAQLLTQQPSGAPDPISQAASEVRQNLVDGDNVAAVQNLDRASRDISDLRAGGEQVDEAVNANYTPEGRLRLQEPSNPNAVTPEELEVLAPVVRPDELVPMPKAHEVIEALRDDPDVFVRNVTPVSRSNADLTALATYLGHVKPRKTPLSSKQIEVLRETHGSLYDKLGRAVDKNKLSNPVTRIEIQAADGVAGKPQVSRLKVIEDFPVPTEFEGNLAILNDLLKKRDNLLANLKNDDVDDLVKVTDDIVNHGTINYAAPQNMDVIQKNLPSELQTSTPNGHAMTVRLVETEDSLADLAAELNNIEAELASLQKLSKEDGLKLADLTSAAPDTLEANKVFKNDFLDGIIKEDVEFIKQYVSGDDLGSGYLSDQLKAINWYHGSRVDPEYHDLRFIDPDKNTTLHEYGPGVYLTTDPETAKYFADAQPSSNLPSGTRLSDSGRVVQVIPQIDGQTLLVNSPPTRMIRDLFRDAAIQAGAPLPVVRSYISKMASSDSMDGFWDMFYETYRGATKNSDHTMFHKFQVTVANKLRSDGYGAILKLPEKSGDESILNILGNGGERMSLDLGKVSEASSPSLLDAMAARANAEKTKGSFTESTEYLKVKARLEYNHTAQDLLKQRREESIEVVEKLLDQKLQLEGIIKNIATDDVRVSKAIDATSTKKSLDDISSSFNHPEDFSPCL